MGFGDDIRGELFGKLGVENESNPLKLIEQGKAAKSEGNNVAAKKSFEQALSIATNQAEKYAAQNQHRSAAEAYYIQALAHGYLDQEDQQSVSYNNVIDRLLDAGKTAVAFGESSRGIASATLAGMVALMNDDVTRSKEIYQNNISVAGEQENAGYLQKLLYSLGYLLDALENDNIGAITDAQNYISTDLKPMLSSAKLTGFEMLLDTVINHTQEQLQSQITMPKLQIGTSIPRDTQFNQLFDVSLNIENIGEGVANNVEMKLEIPDDIEIVDGKSTLSFEEFSPERTEELKLTLRFQTGDTSGEQVREVKGNVSYVDMLGNSHNQFFGPVELEFSATSKKDEFESRLTKTSEPFESLNPEDLSDNVLPVVFDLYKNQIESLKSNVAEKIEAEAFEEAEFGVNILSNIVEQVKVLTESNETTEKFATDMKDAIEKANEQLRQELTSQYEEEKEQALNDLETKKNQEMEDRVGKLKTDLKTEYDNEINQLKDTHQSELQQSQKDYESKLNAGLSQLEGKLKEEFNQEKSKLKKEHEEAIQTVKSEMNQMIEKTKQETREELSSKHKEKVAELEKTIEDLRSQLVSE